MKWEAGWGRRIMSDPKLRAYVDAGRPFPPWDKQPRLRPDLQWIREAYMELATCRPTGMGLFPIPYSAIREYAESEVVLDRERFRYLIRVMDDETLSAAHRSASNG